LTDPNPISGAPSPNHALSLRSRLLGLWSKAATILAIIGLVDLTHQLIEWAGIIHQIATKYAAVREALFAWLPFHVPHEWHNVIVIGTLLFSIINVGFYRSTGRLYIVEAFKLLLFVASGFLPKFLKRFDEDMLSPAFWNAFDPENIENPEWPIENPETIDKLICSISFSVGFACAFFGLIVWAIVSTPRFDNVYWNTINLVLWSTSIFLLLGSLLAWRWILVTAILFGGLFTVNEIYLAWLK
jgi:hypothetical protein